MINKRKPNWLKIKLESGENYSKVKKIVTENKLHTICSSGKCPNIGQCWNSGTATFMILGEICTRDCKFCATQTGKPLIPDENEPQKVAKSINLMQLKHCVITSVTRDDLADKGAGFWAKTIRTVREKNPNTIIEVLTPDFDAIPQFLDIVLHENPHIFSHNMETVESLTTKIRSKASYLRSLRVLDYAAQKNRTASHLNIIIKSGIMLGLGETEAEIVQLMRDLRNVDCELLTVGQYLQPTSNHIPVVEFIEPAQFENYKKIGLEMGFRSVESAPLVRSSYMAEQSFSKICVGSK